jgi:predicted P-loop ATPase
MDKLLSARDIAALERDRDQLWAEAAAREARGESIQLPEELWAIAEREQKEATEDNLFLDVLDKDLGEFVEGKINSADVWTIVDIEPRHRTQQHNDAMGAAMRELGWERTKRRFDGKVRWAYVKGDGRTTIYALRDPVTRTVTVTAGEPENGDDLRSSRSRDTPF